jgi:hypothetical protein
MPYNPNVQLVVESANYLEVALLVIIWLPRMVLTIRSNLSFGL